MNRLPRTLLAAVALLLAAAPLPGTVSAAAGESITGGHLVCIEDHP